MPNLFSCLRSLSKLTSGSIVPSSGAIVLSPLPPTVSESNFSSGFMNSSPHLCFGPNAAALHVALCPAAPEKLCEWEACNAD